MNNTFASKNPEMTKDSNTSISKSTSSMSFEKNLSNMTFDESGNASSPNVKTFLRFKPEDSIENKTYTLASPTTLLAKFSLGNASSVKRVKSKFCVTPTASKRIRFTKIFTPEVSQEEVFEQAVKNDVENFLSGKNCTVMTYGTTNSGKTYTLFGTNCAPGIVTRCINLIFSSVQCTSVPLFKPSHANDIETLSESDRVTEIEARKKLIPSSLGGKTDSSSTELCSRNLAEEEARDAEMMNSIWLSFFEIYNEGVYDLLAEDGSGKNMRLKLGLDKEGTTFVNALKTVHASTALEAHQIVKATMPKLTVAASSLNSNSSRSHVVLSIKLLKYANDCSSTDVEMSTLTFCDLAGSGRLPKNLNDDQRLSEARNINKSLLSLGKCFKIVGENQTTKQNTEIVGPVRESCLTRLFQKTLCEKEPLTLLVSLCTSPDLKTETQNVLDVVASVKKMDSERSGSVRKSLGTAFTAPVSRATSDWDLRSSSTQTFGVAECETLRKQNAALAKELEDVKAGLFDRECEIRHEFADMYSNMLKKHDNEWTKRMEEMENERESYLKWSARQVEDYYEESVGNFSTRKRRRIELGYFGDDTSSIIQNLETENSQMTLKMQSMKATIKRLRLERTEITSQKNECAFQLALTSKELKLLRQSKHRSSYLDESGVSAFSDDGDRESKFNEIESKLLESSSKLSDIEFQLCEKASQVMKLQNRLLERKDELNVLQSMLEKSEESRLASSNYLETLQNVLREKGIDEKTLLRKSSTEDDLDMTLFKASNVAVAENSPNVIARIPKEELPELVDGCNRWSVLESSIDQSIRSSGTSKNDSGITTMSENESRGSKESSNDVQRRVEQLKEDYKVLKSQHEESTRHVAELSEELDVIKEIMESLKMNSAANEHKFAEYEAALLSKEQEIGRLNEDRSELRERYHRLKDDLKLKSQEYLTVLQEFNERLKVREENESRKSKFIEDYLDKTISLGSQLSSAHMQLEKTTMLCFTQHVPKIVELEKELSTKSMHIDELGDKIFEVKKDLNRISKLNEKVNEFEEILENIKLEKKDLLDRLDKKSESQFCLKNKLEKLTEVIQERENEIRTLQKELQNAIENNVANHQKAKSLNEDFAKAAVKISRVKDELLKSEVARENLERTLKQEVGALRTRLSIPENNIAFVNFIQQENKCKQLEINRLKVQLEEKEQEMSLIQRSRDSTVKWYESLMHQLQLEASRKEVAESEDTSQNAIDETHSSTNCSEADSVKNSQSCSFENLETKETDYLYSTLSTINSETSVTCSSSTASMKTVGDTEHFSSTDSEADSKNMCRTQ